MTLVYFDAELKDECAQIWQLQCFTFYHTVAQCIDQLYRPIGLTRDVPRSNDSQNDKDNVINNSSTHIAC